MSAHGARLRVLLVGPLPRAGAPIGGTAVSFAALAVRCRASALLDVDVIDTSRRVDQGTRFGRAAVSACALVRVLTGLARRARACDVILFSASADGMLRAGPFVWFLARLFHRPLCVRVFGGSFGALLDASPRWRRALAERTFLAADLVLLQTRGLCRQFAHLQNVEWLPTTRDVPPAGERRARACRAFLFLGQLRPEKGLADALAASDRLPDGATLTVHGPPMPGTDMRAFALHPRARYAGVVAPEDVPRVLAAHDALVFPSSYAGEGLPGAVVEALQSGMPVIAARWQAIDELVEHERNGLLVAPRSADALAAAMNRLARDDEEFRRLASGARSRGEEFRADRWQARLEDLLRAVSGDARRSRPDHAREPASEPRSIAGPRASAWERRESTQRTASQERARV